MSRARNSRWGMLLHVNEAETDYIYGGLNKIGVHVYHVGISIHAWYFVIMTQLLMGNAH